MSKNRQALRPVDVANWLKQNPTVDGRPATINDGKLAVNWPEWEKALKIKKGNLRENLSILQLARKTPETSGEGTRRAALQYQDEIFKNTLKQTGLPEAEINAIFRRDKAEVKRIRQQVTAYNKQHGGNSMSLGHIRACIEGGGDFSRNVELEPGKGKGGNYSRQNTDEIPDKVSPVQGIVRSSQGGRDAALMHLLYDEFPQLDPRNESPDTRQALREAGNLNQIDDILTKANGIKSKFISVLDTGAVDLVDMVNGDAEKRRKNPFSDPKLGMVSPGNGLAKTVLKEVGEEVVARAGDLLVKQVPRLFK